MITVRTPTGDKAASAVTIRTPTGDKLVARMVLRTPTGDKEFYTSAAGALTVTAEPPSAIGTAYISDFVFVTTNSVTATVSGGTAPYTYAWTRVSGDAGFNALTGSSASTRFRISLDVGGEAFAVFRCTVTDARGRTGTVDVEATAYNFGNFGSL